MAIAQQKRSKSGIDEIEILLNSRRRAILVETFEEERFEEDLKSIIERKGYEAVSWSITSGGVDVLTDEETFKIYDPVRLMKTIQEHDRQCIFILKDFHDLWNNYQAKRALRDVLEMKDMIYKPIILVSPTIQIPTELEKLITTVRYELPSQEQVIEQLEGMERFLESKGYPIPKGREREAIIHALIGMTKTEINNVLKKSAVEYHKISLEEIMNEKQQVIRKTGLLEYITKLGNMDNVGGMDIFKEWAEDAYYAFDPEARKFNVDAVRGAILTGFPGTGKSLLAKSIAHQWNLPLLKMNMSSIMDSKVGQSEKNIDRALKLAEDVSPCVLWVDEFEKALGGMGDDKSDGGTMRRVGQSILTWLSDKEAPVFVIATANDITKLPPELTRAGRFDEIFFVSVPSQEEREEILSIHLKKRGYRILASPDEEEADVFNATTDIKDIAKEMDGFSGAEIEQVVAEAGRKAYAEFRKNKRETHYITKEDLLSQVEKTIPMSKRNPEILTNLREWAKHSAKCASTYEHQILHGGEEEKSNKLFSLNELDLDLD